MLDAWAEGQPGTTEHNHLPPRQKTHLLVIDDNASIHEALGLLLEPEDVVVQSTLSGPEGPGNDGELMEQASQYAPVLLLTKPVGPALLERTVHTVIGEKLASVAAGGMP